jgi:hypothetical protein
MAEPLWRATTSCGHSGSLGVLVGRCDQRAAMTKRNDPKRHHYIPEFYQSGFVDADGYFWLYDRKVQVFRKAHPRTTCYEKELYTIDPTGTPNRIIETNHLNQVDGEGATAIRELAAGRILSQPWVESFSIFMGLLLTRSPAFRTKTTEESRAMAEEFMRLEGADVERAQRGLESERKRTGKPFEGVTAESIVEAVRGGHLRVSVNEGPFLKQMFKQVEFLSRWIASFEWQILSAANGTGFIISDYPFVLVPPRKQPHLTGFGFPGTVKHFPLTRRLCLRMGEQGSRASCHSATREEVRIINQNTAVNSERFIMGPSRPQLEHIIARSGTHSLDPVPRNSVEVVTRDSESSLLSMTFWPRRTYFYS